MSSTANNGCFKLRHEMLKHKKNFTSKVTAVYKMQKIIQLKDLYKLELSKLMYKYTNSQVPATTNNYFKLITNVHRYDTRQINLYNLLC